MKSLRHALFLTLLCCASSACAQDEADEEYHPNDEQVRQLQRSCAVSDAGMVTLEEKVLSALSDWRKETATEGPLTAMRRLDGYLEKVRSQTSVSGKKAIYILCVEKAVRQFVEVRREQPRVLVATGSSHQLQRMSFGSEEEIWREGCRQAEADALEKLRARCGERNLVQTSSDCAQGTGSVRTYNAQVNAECRNR